jgi:death on curing protein
MDEPIWLSRLILDTIQSELLAEHGGAPGIRAGGDDLIESALARPLQKHAYGGEVDLADLAAAYLFGLVKNHGYVDGNKRIGFAAAATFLLLNGWRLRASEVDAYERVIATVEGRISEAQLASWIRENTTPAD